MSPSTRGSVLLALLAVVPISFGCASGGGVPTTGDRVAPTYVGAPLGGMGRVGLGEETTASHTLDAPPDRVFSVLPAVYQRLGVEVTVIDRTAMQVGNTQFRPRRIAGKRLSEYLECGRGMTAAPHADTYEVSMSLLSRVAEADEGRTRLIVEINASAKPRDFGGHAVRCGSKGTLEMLMADLALEAMLNLPPGA